MGNSHLGEHTSAFYPGSATDSVWANYVTSTYNTTPVLTYNFAVGGASIPDNYAYQVMNLYQPKYTKGNKFWTGSNTLHLSWIGINVCHILSLLTSIFVQPLGYTSPRFSCSYGHVFATSLEINSMLTINRTAVPVGWNEPSRQDFDTHNPTSPLSIIDSVCT